MVRAARRATDHVTGTGGAGHRGGHMIAHLTYVRCDRCGNPAQPADDAPAARRVASREGFERRDSVDICPSCQLVEAEPVTEEATPRTITRSWLAAADSAGGRSAGAANGGHAGRSPRSAVLTWSS